MTAKKHSRLEEFEGHCRYWLGAFGMTDWVPVFKNGGSSGCLAEVSYNHKSRGAEFRLSKTKSRDRELRMTALHEVWHLLLADLSGMAEEIKRADVVLQEEHKVIARLENYITKQEAVMFHSKKRKGGGCGK